MEYMEIIFLLGTPIATVAAALGGTKVALNGTRERVKDIDKNLNIYIKENNQTHADLLQRLSVTETKIDDLRCRKENKAI